MSVRFEVEHSVMGRIKEQVFPLDTPISKIKDRLYLVCGTEPKNQRISFLDPSGIPSNVVEDDTKTLAELGVGPGYVIYVQDVDPSSQVASLQDVSQVPKYTISEESYGKRENFRKFLAEKKAAAAAAPGATTAQSEGGKPAAKQ